MKRRKFLYTTGLVSAGAGIAGLSACTSPSNQKENQSETPSPEVVESMEFSLPALGYDFGALEPHIDARTMEIHHGKHHAGYVRKLNKALSEAPKSGSLEEMLSQLKDNEADLGVRNNGGGHYNHSLFWEVISPGSQEGPSGKLQEALAAHFGDFDGFAEEFQKAAATVFGSGWAWLCVDEKNNLFVSSTPNQDNPLMKGLVERPGRPILGIDVWEHAYYLNYQNRRKDYIQGFMQLVNWEKVASKL